MGLELHRDITYARHAVDVYFTLPDCMGDAYVRAVDAETGFVTAIKAGGEIPDGVYMVLPEAAAESVSVQSALSAGGASTCSNQPLNTYDAYLLVENDPETSGALSGDYGRVTHTP